VGKGAPVRAIRVGKIVRAPWPCGSPCVHNFAYPAIRPARPPAVGRPNAKLFDAGMFCVALQSCCHL
jgi:hypothetical protein